jgi:hypothetical protein
MRRERQDAVAIGRLGAGAGGVVEQRVHKEGARTMRAAGRLQRLEIRSVGSARNRDEIHVMCAKLLEQDEITRVFHEHGIAG